MPNTGLADAHYKIGSLIYDSGLIDPEYLPSVAVNFIFNSFDLDFEDLTLCLL